MSRQLETPPLCRNGCGFFGTPSTNNLCSKCYKLELHVAKDDQESTYEMMKVSSRKELASLVNRLLASSTRYKHNAASSNDDTNGLAEKKCCALCKKKIKLVGGFACRCGGMFCSIHRLPEQHSCSFDYKEVGRVTLAKENPLVSKDKLETRI